MRRLTFGLFIFVVNFSAPCFALNFDPFAGPQPLVILIQTDPWAMVMGVDTPRIAIYQSGDVIFSRLSQKYKRADYLYTKLDSPALSEVTDRLRSLTNLSDLKPRYILTRVTDQSSSLLYLRVDNKEVVTSVYGLNSDGTPDNIQRFLYDPLPTHLRDLYRYLCNLEFAEASPWRPAFIETMIWPYNYASEESIRWPRTWPDLNSDRVAKWGDGYSIFLDGSMQDALRRFLASRREKGAVEVNGKKWAVSWRPAFPSEQIWKKAFSRAAIN